MIRRNQAFLNRLNVLLDLLLVIAAYMLASWFWLGLLEHSSENMAAVNRHTVIMSGIYAACLILLMLVMGFYGTTRTRGLKWKLRVILIAVTVVTRIRSGTASRRYTRKISPGVPLPMLRAASTFPGSTPERATSTCRL